MDQSVAFVAEVSDYLDQMIPTATDDELFAAGYLRGHFDLAVGTLQVAAEPFAKPELLAQVNVSLSQAIDQGELSEQDQQLVQSLWQQLQQLPA
ncbi:YfcL family protein [Alkalimonas collagenimarina]|uniref:YfcL family protein n=1 Tax=Alkalimonas collagenimarina TaxID=400390 RepID=A0ABT9GZH8_9GAMM|nr:YfcL family protein [Alkalimonas collagenimarina]MDP4536428.1 YfcL family protein [Alkalimonas collagenimarina]